MLMQYFALNLFGQPNTSESIWFIVTQTILKHPSKGAVLKTVLIHYISSQKQIILRLFKKH